MSENAKIIIGDCRTVLAGMEAESVDCCVTSPPYWGLRDYGNAAQIGLEPSIDAWVSEIVQVMEGVRRVLKPTGTLWLNLGDSYASNGGGGGSPSATMNKPMDRMIAERKVQRLDGLKPKDLIGQPWLVAFALRDAGWYLRSEIIWHKPNPMPESVTDRPTKAHEQIFLFSKSPKYFYDAAAIAEQLVSDPHSSVPGNVRAGFRGGDDDRYTDNKSFDNDLQPKKRMPPIGGVKAVGENGNGNPTYSGNTPEFRDTRNSRSVWTIPTQGYKGSHFATFPRELAARCIKAGCPMGGLVLDPFGGTGTTVAEAVMLGRRGVCIELNPEYAKLAEKRIDETCGLLARGAA